MPTHTTYTHIHTQHKLKLECRLDEERMRAESEKMALEKEKITLQTKLKETSEHSKQQVVLGTCYRLTFELYSETCL